jgi:hypothetical protein
MKAIVNLLAKRVQVEIGDRVFLLLLIIFFQMDFVYIQNSIVPVYINLELVHHMPLVIQISECL